MLAVAGVAGGASACAASGDDDVATPVRKAAQELLSVVATTELVAVSTIVSIDAELHIGGHVARPKGIDAWLDRHLLDHLPGADHETQ